MQKLQLKETTGSIRCKLIQLLFFLLEQRPYWCCHGSVYIGAFVLITNKGKPKLPCNQSVLCISCFNKEQLKGGLTRLPVSVDHYCFVIRYSTEFLQGEIFAFLIWCFNIADYHFYMTYLVIMQPTLQF